MPAAAPDPGAGLVTAAAARERALLTAYDDVLAQHSDLAGLLSPYREDHAAHLHALDPGTVVSATVSPTTSRTSRRARARAQERLRALESRAGSAHARAAVTAPPAQAPLLASLAACEHSHAALL